MTHTQRHSLITTSALKGAQVDKENRRIIGFVVTSIGPAIGHGERIDEESLRQVVALGNGSSGAAGPIRARMDHPPRGDMTVENPLSKLLGRPMNFRIDGDRVIADLQLLSASAAPDSDRLLNLASEAPDLFGASLVFDYADADTHMALVKKGKNPPVRFGNILAVDFVDLPATNPSGLFSATLNTQEKKMSKCSAYVRNGGLYGSMEGEEFEIEMPDEWEGKSKKSPEGKKDIPKDDDKGAHSLGSGITVDAEKIKADAIAEERAYRTNFHTAMTTANLTGEAATTFENTFYGRSIDDVKYLASHAIGARAKAVGEGTGDVTETEEQKKAKADESFVAGVTKEWASNSQLRKMHGVTTNNASDPLYVSRLNRLIQIERKMIADNLPGASLSSDREPGDSDPITRVLKNKSLLNVG